ncbi:MAG: cupin domain-containing protein [Betaproteobacteria bacterium]|jgi:mannose-6-phosphate isomerase-like protein (cupin superfamily)|nr:cupin domain-containing protein [Betaproteobacteria bacterium]
MDKGAMPTPAFATLSLAEAHTERAPDGSMARVLARLPGASMAQFELEAGRVSRAVVHRTIDEIWYVIGGRGELWRRQPLQEETVALAPGMCLTIPCGTEFQFRALGVEALRVLGVSLPPWPGEGEAAPVTGPWIG